MKIIICPKCNTPNLKKTIAKNESAVCHNCGKVLYQNIKGIEYYLFSFSISILLFFLISNLYPIIEIDILGYKGEFSILETLFFLFSNDYIFLALFTFFTVFLFPLILILVSIVFSFLLILGFKSKKLLITIGVLKDFIFIDIFFIGVLVSYIKVMEYGDININIGFYTYIFVLIYFIYFFKYIKFHNYWEI